MTNKEIGIFRAMSMADGVCMAYEATMKNKELTDRFDENLWIDMGTFRPYFRDYYLRSDYTNDGYHDYIVEYRGKYIGVEYSSPKQIITINMKYMEDIARIILEAIKQHKMDLKEET